MPGYKRRDSYRKLFEFLVDAEIKGQKVTNAEIATSTGYKAGSMGAYIRNKLKNVYLYEVDQDKYEVRGLKAVTFESFAYYMSQKSHDVEDRGDSLMTSLRNRSLQAFYLSLGIYNNPTQRYRIESFCILLANAWELLLKARLLETRGEPAIERTDGKTISLMKAVEAVFPDHDNPIRRNIETLNEIRDKAVHLLIPDIQRTLSRLFQSSVLNYLRTVNDFRYPNPYAAQLPGLLSLVSDYDDLSDSAIATKYGDGTREKIRAFLTEVADTEKALDSLDFAIPLQYKVVMTKDEKEGDLKLTPSKEGDGTVVRLIEVPKDHNRTHPYRQKEVIAEVNRILAENGVHMKFSNYSFQGMLLKEKIRKTPENEFHHKIMNPPTSTYSDNLVDLIVRKATTNPQYEKTCKDIWTKHLKAQRHKSNAT